MIIYDQRCSPLPLLFAKTDNIGTHPPPKKKINSETEEKVKNEMKKKIPNSNRSYISPIENTNQKMVVHGPLNISEVGLGDMEE
jgi:hypothetical protein